MPARTGKTTYVPGRGATTRSKSGKAKTFTGSGPAPAGTKKVAEKSYSEVPTVTVASDGSVSTSGYRRKSAARRAVAAQEKRAKRVQRIVHLVTAPPETRSVKVKLPKRHEAPLPKPSKASRVYEPDPAKAVISSVPNPNSKPPTFQGHKTAGEPSRRELQKAAKKGALRVNRKGHVTTPRIRKVGGELRRLRSKARSSNAPLPGLDAEQTAVARKVLRTGKKEGASRKELLAAAETGLVESDFRNLDYGDADSQGWRQERTSIYGTQDPRNVKAGARNFFEESISDTGGARGRGQTAGELAQTIQGSAFPERYDEVKPEAAAIVKAFTKGGLKPAQQKKLRVVSKEAKELGLKAGGTSKVGPAPKKVVTRFEAAKVAMKEVEGLPYVWGGGHGSPTSSPTGGGLDCSGAVGYVLNKIGAMKGSLTSGAMGSVLKPGPGALTVFYNGEHTFLRLGNEYWGTSVGDSGAGGLGPHPAPSASYLASYNVGHVPGLGRKQALQLGFKNLGSGGAQSFPGMTLSSGGTTATINSGAGTEVSGKPGFSKQPIRLTPQQRVRKAEVKLKRLSSPKTAAPSTDVLDALERKYGAAA